MKRARAIAYLTGAIGAAACCVVALQDASAQPGRYPYCAASRGHEENYMDCSFATLEACLEELKGMRGNCALNPYYVAPPPRAPSSSKPQRVHPRQPS